MSSAVAHDVVELAPALLERLLGLFARGDIETLAVQLGRRAFVVKEDAHAILEPDLMTVFAPETIVICDGHHRRWRQRGEAVGGGQCSLGIIRIDTAHPERRIGVQFFDAVTQDIERIRAVIQEDPALLPRGIQACPEQDSRAVAHALVLNAPGLGQLSVDGLALADVHRLAIELDGVSIIIKDDPDAVL